MLESPVIRYLAIIIGTVLWDAGAVLQKKAVSAMPAGRLPVTALLGSGRWMAGLLATALGWGMFVFGLDRVPVSAARTITGGSYVVLALFSMIFLRSPLSAVEWAALALVTAGIVLLGINENPVSTPPVPQAARVLLGMGCVAILALGVFLVTLRQGRGTGSRTILLFCFSALSGLLGSVGDLLTKVSLALVSTSPAGHVPVLILSAAGFITFYLAGFYMLSRAYQVGSVVGGVVVSDFFARAGAVFLGALSLAEPIGGAGAAGVERGLGFLLVLGGSLLLGRFSGASPAQSKETISSP